MRPRAGFSLLEALVASVIVVIAMVSLLNLFDANGRLAAAQIQISEMQQAGRVAQLELIKLARMAGRGSLPRGVLPQSLALAVRNGGVGAAEHIAAGDEDAPRVLAGTDVLTVRGVLSTPIFKLDPRVNPLQLDDPTLPATGSVVIQDPGPMGVPQGLGPLIAAIASRRPEALVLVGPLGQFSMVELDPLTSNSSDPAAVRIGFKIGVGTHGAAYLGLAGGFPATLRSIVFLGILEEHRFYIRDDRDSEAAPLRDLTPRLSRARFYPATEVAYPGTDSLKLDYADGILDLQLALGIDRDGNGQILDTGGADDEWLYNHQDDDPADPAWNGIAGATPPALFYLRISTLARTIRPDRGHAARPLTVLEDRVYGETLLPASQQEREGRLFHRSVLQTIVDLRNL